METSLLASAISFIDSWLPLRYEHSDVPGIAVAISHKGEVVFNKAYGYANLEKEERLATSHIFRIASHSKTFTATAIMQLAEQDKLKLDDHVMKYLPWLESHKDRRYQKITIRQLMSHSAGIIRDGLDRDYAQLKRPYPESAQFRDEILEAGLITDTNLEMKYSNLGFAILGMIIEAVSNRPYNQFVMENVIRPLRLKNTFPDYSEPIKDRFVTGYTRADLNRVRFPIPTVISTKSTSAARGFCSTADDLCRFFSAHFIGSKQLLDDESKKEMQRTHWEVRSKEKQEYGLGLAVEYIGSRRTFGHGGAAPGMMTSTLCDPQNELVVVVLMNCIDADPKLVCKGIYSILSYFESCNSASKSIHDLKRFQGRFMNLWEIKDIVVVGSKIAALCPNVWQPFDEVEELQYIDDHTLKVVNANGYLSKGERVEFRFSEASMIESIRYCGMTMWPKLAYLEALSKENAPAKQISRALSH